MSGRHLRKQFRDGFVPTLWAGAARVPRAEGAEVDGGRPRRPDQHGDVHRLQQGQIIEAVSQADTSQRSVAAREEPAQRGDGDGFVVVSAQVIEPAAVGPAKPGAFDRGEQMRNPRLVRREKRLVVLALFRQRGLRRRKGGGGAHILDRHAAESGNRAACAGSQRPQRCYQFFVGLAPFEHLVTVPNRGVFRRAAEVPLGNESSRAVLGDERMGVAHLAPQALDFGAGLARHHHPRNASRREQIERRPRFLPRIGVRVEKTSVEVRENGDHLSFEDSVRRIAGPSAGWVKPHGI